MSSYYRRSTIYCCGRLTTNKLIEPALPEVLDELPQLLNVFVCRSAAKPARYANSSAAFSMRSAIGTPKGQRGSQAAQAVQSSAVASSAR